MVPTSEEPARKMNSVPLSVSAESPSQRLTIDSKVNSLDAVQRAAYRLSDRASIQILLDDDSIICDIYTIADINLGGVINDFRTFVTDETLRERIRNQTEPIRNLILSVAFSQVNLDSEES